MATDTADFYLRLHEDVNAPAKRAAAAVRQLSGGLVTSQRELARTESALASFYRKQAAAPAKAAEERSKSIRKATSAVAGGVGGKLFGGTAGELLGGLGGAELGPWGAAAGVITAGLGSVIDLAKMAAGAVYDLGAKFISTTAEAIDFGQRSRLAFGFLLGDKNQGREQFDAVRQEAVGLGLDVHNTVDAFRQLLAAQFSVGQSHDLVKLGADMQALGADADHVQRIMYALSEVKSIGSLQQRQIRMLQMAGISGELIDRSLQKRLGVNSSDKVASLRKKNKIGADVAIEAIKDAVMAKAHEGALGQAGSTFANEKLSGMLAQAQGTITNWFIDLGNRLEPGATRMAKKAFGLFKELAGAPDTADFADMVVQSFQGIEDWVNTHWGDIRTEVVDDYKALAKGATDLRDAASGAADFITDHWDAVEISLKAALGVTALLAASLAVMAISAAALAAPFIIAAGAIGYLTYELIASREEAAKWLQTAGAVLAFTGVGALPGAALYGAGAAIRPDQAAAAAATGASTGQAGSKTINVQSITTNVDLKGLTSGDPHEVGGEINKQIQAALHSILEQSS